MKKLTTFLLLLMGISFNTWANSCGDCDAVGAGSLIPLEDPAITAKKNKAYEQERIKKARDLINLDNRLTQQYEVNKTLIPFVDYLDQVKEIDNQEGELYSSNLYTGTKKTIQALIDYHQNHRKNMDRGLRAAKQRGYEKYEQLEKIVLRKKVTSTEKEQKLRNSLKRAE